MGLVRTRNLVYELSSRVLFRSPRARVRAAMSRVWDHALGVAAIARRVAVVIGRALDPEEVHLAGLLQDIGKPVVAAYLLEAERMLGLRGVEVTEEVWPPVLERAHRPVGVALAARWGLPLTVQRVIAGGDRYHDGVEGLMANVVHFADGVALAQVPGSRCDAVDDRLAEGAERLRLDWRFVHELTAGA
jgi:putative nucleotidyltransferase with HDIG domain